MLFSYHLLYFCTALSLIIMLSSHYHHHKSKTFSQLTQCPFTGTLLLFSLPVGSGKGRHHTCITNQNTIVLLNPFENKLKLMVEYVYEMHRGWSLILDDRPIFFHHRWICDIAVRDDITTHKLCILLACPNITLAVEWDVKPQFWHQLIFSKDRIIQVSTAQECSGLILVSSGCTTSLFTRDKSLVLLVYPSCFQQDQS